jgi:hypothetical protein
MELASRITKQDAEMAKAARGFKKRSVTMILNDPVIVLLQEQGFFLFQGVIKNNKI